MSEEKAYVIVRSDLTRGYQIVQSCHAVAEHELLFPESMSGRTMVVLGVPNGLLLTLLYNHITKVVGMQATLFFEPDIEEWTAMAVSPSENWEIFKGLPLAGS